MRRLALLVLALVAGCASPPPVVGSSGTPRLPEFTTSAAPVTRPDRAVPTSCGEVVTPAEVDAAVDAPVAGRTTAVLGVALPSIGRTARIDCYFGIPEGRPPGEAAVTVALAGYTNPDAAAARVRATVAAERERGITPVEIPVGPDSGTYLDGPTRILVVAHGSTTVVVTAISAVLTPETAVAALTALADRALTPRG